MLVEQQWFQLASTREHEIAQLSTAHPVGDRVDAQLGEVRHLDRDVIGVEHHHLAERARVDEAQLERRIAGQQRRHMSVRRTWFVGVVQQHPSAHPQVDHHVVTAVESDQQVLAAAPGVDDGGACQAVDDSLSRRAAHRPFTADLDALDGPSDQSDVEPAPHRLDLGQLGHARTQPSTTGTGSAVVSTSWAAIAAACSAIFFERPLPSPTVRPATITVASNSFW